jgi:lipopolysaccharide/colanic/teichoic acid biosynthesis glycosyltransferase
VFSRHNRMIAALYLLGDALMVLASCSFAYYARSHFFPHLRVFYTGRFYLWLMPAVLLIWICTGLAAGIYREIREDDWRSVLWDPLKVNVMATLILLAFTVAVKDEYVSRLLITLFSITVLAAMIALRLAARQFGPSLRAAFGNVQQLLVVGRTPEALEIAREIEINEAQGVRLAGFALPGAAGAAKGIDHPQPLIEVGSEQRQTQVIPEGSRLTSAESGLARSYPLYALRDLAELLRAHVIDEVIFAVSRDELEGLEETFLLCEEEGVKSRVLVSFFPHVISRVYLERLRDMPLLTFSTTPENELLLLAKRVVDFAMALALGVLLSPLFLVLALVIKLTSRGPILYRQTRCGLGGRKFTLYKFRSMHQYADEQRRELLPLNELDGPVFKIRDDPRCTRAGRFMRRFSLDELPQLINIIKGDMSFVGPRPPLPEEVAHYERWQRRRLRMQPGLTCLWALEGRNKLNFRRWMELDLEYIDTWSPALDWKILLKTIPVVLLGRGAS